MPVAVGRMPTRRAPTRLTAVARSALPRGALEEQEEQAAEDERRGHDQQHLAADDEARRASNTCRSAAWCARLPGRRTAGRGRPARNAAPRDDQQHQHRGVGDRPEHDAVEQRRDRHDQRSDKHDPDGIGRVVPPASQTAAAGTAAAGRDRTAARAAGDANARPRTSETTSIRPRARTGEHSHQADRARRPPVSSAARVSAVKAAMSPNGTKTTRVTAKISTRPSADQDIDRAVGDAVDRQDAAMSLVIGIAPSCAPHSVRARTSTGRCPAAPSRSARSSTP